MKQATVELLHAVNRRFYVQHAEEFSATRRTPWPGLERALAPLTLATGTAGHARVLDLGCGNGRALPALQRRFGAALSYLGIDASEPLLAIARERWVGPALRFAHADFVATDPERALPAERFDLVLLLGVLHCVPSEAGRRALLAAAARRVAHGGLLALTIWRFDRDPRFAERRVAAERLAQILPALTPAELDPGDELLGFGKDPETLRYAHFPGEAELARLTAELPIRVQIRFSSDGSGQQLNDYLLLRA